MSELWDSWTDPHVWFDMVCGPLLPLKHFSSVHPHVWQSCKWIRKDLGTMLSCLFGHFLMIQKGFSGKRCPFCPLSELIPLRSAKLWKKNIFSLPIKYAVVCSLNRAHFPFKLYTVVGQGISYLTTPRLRTSCLKYTVALSCMNNDRTFFPKCFRHETPFFFYSVLLHDTLVSTAVTDARLGH